MSVLNITHRCNLRCPYCFETFKDKNVNRPDDMSSEIIQKSLDFVYKRNSTNYIVLYGGEPFLCPDSIEQVWQYHKKHNIHNGMVMTNVTTITPEIAKMLYRYKQYMGCVVCSIDSLTNSCKSLDKVKDKLEILDTWGISYTIQPTITSETLHSTYDTIMEFLKWNTREINMRYICGDKQFTSKEEIDQYEEICKRIFKDSHHDPRIWYYKRFSPPKLFTKPGIPLYCSEYLEYGTPSLNIDTDGKCYFCEHYCDRQEKSIGDIVTGVDYEKLQFPDNFNCSPTRCFYFDCHNDYFNKSINRFKTYLINELKEESTAYFEEDTDSIYKLSLDIHKALQRHQYFINVKLIIKKDVYIPKLKDFLSFLHNFNSSKYITINLEVEDHAGIL